MLPIDDETRFRLQLEMIEHLVAVERDEDWHGTTGGYRRHRRHGEQACAACRLTHSQYVQDHKGNVAKRR